MIKLKYSNIIFVISLFLCSTLNTEFCHAGENQLKVVATQTIYADIVKEIADNKDEFLQIRETLSNPELSKITQDIVKEYFELLKEGRPPKEQIFTPERVKQRIEPAVHSLMQSGFVINDPNSKGVLVHWLTQYTIGLIQAITGYTLPL
jgi:hypothetical protein